MWIHYRWIFYICVIFERIIPFVSSPTKGTNDKLFVWWANGKRMKEKQLSFLCLKRKNIYIYIYVQYMYMYIIYMVPFSVYIYIYIPKTELIEKWWNGKQKWKTSVCLLQTETIIFLGRWTISGNRRLLFLQTCPSMTIFLLSLVVISMVAH